MTIHSRAGMKRGTHWRYNARLHTHDIFLQRAYTLKLCRRVMYKNDDDRMSTCCTLFSFYTLNSHSYFFNIVSPQRNLYKYCVIYQWHLMYFYSNLWIIWTHTATATTRRLLISWTYTYNRHIGINKEQ